MVFINPQPTFSVRVICRWAPLLLDIVELPNEDKILILNDPIDGCPPPYVEGEDIR